MSEAANGLDQFVDQASYALYEARTSNLEASDEESNEEEQMSEDKETVETSTPPDSAFLQPPLQSVQAPTPTIIPYTSRSTEAKMFAAQQAWLMNASPDLVSSLATLDPALGTIMNLPAAHISLQASKMSAKAKEEPVKCSECKEWFFSSDKLTVHLISNHGRHHCSYCPQMFVSDATREAHEVSTHFPLECDICLVAVSNLDQHYEEIHEMRNCRYCGVLVKPKSYYQVHVRRKHFVTCLEALEERDVRLVGDWSDKTCAWNFHCHLCGKERKRADIFGHFFSYHRLSLMCLVVFLRTEQMLFSVRGTMAPPGIEDATCAACAKQFTFQVPKPVHDVFCRRLHVCRYCSQTFEDRAERDAHSEANHVTFTCVRGCEKAVVFTQEGHLQAHYQEVHSETACQYCEALLPNSLSQLSDHLKSQHAASSRSKALLDCDMPLLQVDRHSSHVTCSLCCANITSSSNDLSLLCKHFQRHSLSLAAILQALETHNTLGKAGRGKRKIGEEETKRKEEKEESKKKTGEEESKKTGEEESKKKEDKEKRKPGKSAAAKKPLNLSKVVCERIESLETNGFTDRETVIMDGTKEASNESVEASSSEVTSDEESGISSEGEEGEEEEAVPEDRGAGGEMGEAEIDPTEIECVIDDTSDDENHDEEEDERLLVKRERVETDESSSCEAEPPDARRRAMDALERTMEDMFQDTACDVVPQDSTNGVPHVVKSKAAQKCYARVIKPEPEAEMQLLDAIFKCEICPKGKPLLRSPVEYIRHMKTFHKFAISPHCTATGPEAAANKEPEDSNTLSEEVAAGGSEVFQCPFCAIRSVWRCAIRHHVCESHAAACATEPPAAGLGYDCRYCQRGFWRPAERNEHQISSHEEQMFEFYKCYVCSHISSSKLLLTRHLRVSHPAESQYSAISYKCKLCLLTYPTLGLLRDHFTATHPAAMVFPCTLCNITLKNKKTLKSHMKNVHVSETGRPRDCALCGKVLYSKRAHAIHYRMKHSQVSKVGFRCRICQQRFDTKDDRKMHYAVDHLGESPYHCGECGKGFASKSGMYGHKQLHTGSGVSKCQYCGKEFTRKDSYNEHLLIHNGPRHKCPHCIKEFVQRSNLVRHIRIHTGEKPYKCLYCDKCFSDKGACNSHIRVHTREETCSCPYCGQTFSKKQKLKYHIRKHTGEGLINCEVCSKSFTNSFALKEHRLIHNRQTSILCGTCGKGFNSEKYLQRHVAIVHEPQHSFTCPLCAKCFSQQTRLKSHLMTHTGVKHMKCLLCDKAYSVRKSLRRHLLEKHQIAPDHPQYKRCFYAMTHQEAGLQIPADMSFFVSFEEDSGSQTPQPDKMIYVKKSPRKTGKKSSYVESHDAVGLKKGRRKLSTKKADSEADKPSTSDQSKKRQKAAPKKLPVEKPGGSLEDSSFDSDSSRETSSARGKGIGNIVDRLQKRLGPGRKKQRVEEIVETLQKASETREEDSSDDSSDDEPVLARMAALNSPQKGGGVGRRNLNRKPVPERIPRKARAGKNPEEESS